MDAKEMYLTGDYAKQNPTWHLEDGVFKAQEIFPYIIELIKLKDYYNNFKIAEVGAGTGVVLNSIRLLSRSSDLVDNVNFTVFEISEFAINIGKDKFPLLDLRHEDFLETKDTFDLILLVDVLEHLENPDMLLRAVFKRAKYVIVRQPLENTIAAFLKNRYAEYRETIGHINYFNYKSFIDLMARNRLKPTNMHLFAPWERLKFRNKKHPMLKKIVTKINKPCASLAFNGFLLIGLFEKEMVDFASKANYSVV